MIIAAVDCKITLVIKKQIIIITIIISAQCTLTMFWKHQTWNDRQWAVDNTILLIYNNYIHRYFCISMDRQFSADKFKHVWTYLKIKPTLIPGSGDRFVYINRHLVLIFYFYSDGSGLVYTWIFVKLIHDRDSFQSVFVRISNDTRTYALHMHLSTCHAIVWPVIGKSKQ